MNTNNNATARLPKLSLYHPNAKCTGAALHMALQPASGVLGKTGFFTCFIVPQKTVGDTTAMTFATFDREKGIPFTLGFEEVCKFLEVFRGETESVNEEKGLYQRLASGDTNIIKLRHIIDGYHPCYELEVYRGENKSSEGRGVKFCLTTSEALGLSLAMEQSMRLLTFGTEVEAAAFEMQLAKDIEEAKGIDEATRKAIEAKTEEAKIHEKEALGFIFTDALSKLIAHFGADDLDAIREVCSRATEDGEGITEEERQLGANAIGEDHPIWQFIKVRKDR